MKKQAFFISKIFSLFILIAFASCDSSDQHNHGDNKSAIQKIESFDPAPTEKIKFDDQSEGLFRTTKEIKYRDHDGKVWSAPKGTNSDGASIPDIFVDLLGGKKNDQFLFAAIIHDAYCGYENKDSIQYQRERWEDTHHMFYHACIDNGTPLLKASTMYAAVRMAGPRWSFNGESFEDPSKVDKEVLMSEMEHCMHWIEEKGSTLKLEELDKMINEREQIYMK